MAFVCRLCGVDGVDRSKFIYLLERSKPAADNLEFIRTQLHIWVMPEDFITQYMCLQCSTVNDLISQYLVRCQSVQVVLREKEIMTRVAAATATPDTGNIVQIKEEQGSNQIKTEHHDEDDIEIIDEDDNSFVSQLDYNGNDDFENWTQIDENSGRVPTVNDDAILASIATLGNCKTKSPLNSDAKAAAAASQDTGNIVKIKEEPQPEKIKTEHHDEDDIETIYKADNSFISQLDNYWNDNFENWTQMDENSGRVPTVNNDAVLAPNATLGKPKTEPPLNSDEPTVYDVESDEEVVEDEKAISAPLPQKQCFRCMVCKEIKPNRKAMSDHFHKDHTEISLYCYQCDYVTLFNDRLNQHVKECHDKNFKCDVCHAKFGKSSKLRTHYAAVHTDGLPINCTLCDKEFKQKYEYQKHERLVHLVDGYWVCHICKEEFAQRHLLELHVMKSHFTDKKIKCPVEGCEYYARHKYYMTQHYRDVHDKKFTCQICGKLFCKLNRINDHMRRKHTPKEEMKCPKCKQIFKSRAWYNRHLEETCIFLPFNNENLAKIQDTIDC